MKSRATSPDAGTELISGLPARDILIFIIQDLGTLGSYLLGLYKVLGYAVSRTYVRLCQLYIYRVNLGSAKVL
jgi:hypothetical protein